jgi:hypothetical protein
MSYSDLVQLRRGFDLTAEASYCPMQAYELAKALGVEIITPPVDDYTSVDGGGHLDRKSAERFTGFLMSELIKTDAYRRAFPEKRHLSSAN